MARMLLSFTAINIMAGRLSANWWHEIKESTKWQDIIFFALCAAYALLSLVALVGPVTAICFTCFLIRCFVVRFILNRAAFA